MVNTNPSPAFVNSNPFTRKSAGECVENIGSISPIERTSTVSAGTTGTFFEALLKPAFILHRVEYGQSPAVGNRNIDSKDQIEPEIEFSDVQPTPKNQLEDDYTPLATFGLPTCGNVTREKVEELKLVQKALNEILGTRIEETGQNNEETREAVVQYQTNKKLAPTGEIDEDFVTAIMQDVKNKQQGRLQI